MKTNDTAFNVVLHPHNKLNYFSKDFFSIEMIYVNYQADIHSFRYTRDIIYDFLLAKYQGYGGELDTKSFTKYICVYKVK